MFSYHSSCIYKDVEQCTYIYIFASKHLLYCLAPYMNSPIKLELSCVPFIWSHSTVVPYTLLIWKLSCWSLVNEWSEICSLIYSHGIPGTCIEIQPYCIAVHQPKITTCILHFLGFIELHYMCFCVCICMYVEY